jgi:hypothetical protein
MPKKSTSSSTPNRQGLKRKDAMHFSQAFLQPAAFLHYFEIIRRARGHLRKTVVTEDEHPTLFYHALEIFGPWYRLRDEKTLLALQMIWAKARKGEKHAKKILQEVAEALSWIGRGLTSPLTDDQKNQRQKKSSQLAHQKTRAANAAKREEAHF